MRKLFSASLFAGMAIAADAPPMSQEDFVRVVKNVYLCGRLDGVFQVFTELGRSESAAKVQKLADEASCENVRRLAKP